MDKIEQSLTNLETAFDRFKNAQESRLDTLEAKHLRPQLETKEILMDSNAYQHKTAFINYLKKGDETDLRAYESKSLTAGVEKDGGFFIPHMLSAKMKERLADQSVIRSIANVLTISTDAVDMLVDTKEPAVGWTGEVAERKETDTPELSKIKIPVHELYARPRATTKLLEDASINVEEWLIERIAQKMAQMENAAFILGDGDNKPKGFLGYKTADKNKWEWGLLEHVISGEKGDFLEKLGADVLIDCVNALRPEYHKHAVWVMSRSAHAAIRKLKDETQQYLWQPGLGGDKLSTLLGYPVLISNDMPPLEKGKTSASVAFGDFQQGYQIVDRNQIHVLRDPYSAKPYVEFYTTCRVGGDVTNFEAIKVIQFSDN